ncbi:hypothetical protein DMUE_3489 [Dictyocoela muelleri]|nr:hypothetical protein DMUE_3489 [Dictyocoela muelleri]
MNFFAAVDIIYNLFEKWDYSTIKWVFSNFKILIFVGVLLCILCGVFLSMACIFCVWCCRNHCGIVNRNNHGIEEGFYHIRDDSVVLPHEYNTPNPATESNEYNPNTGVVITNEVDSENQQINASNNK